MSLFPEYGTVLGIQDAVLRAEALELARTAFGGDISIGAVRVYDRKGEETFDDVHNRRNTSYGSTSDPLVLFIKIELPSHFSQVKAFISHAEEVRTEAERAATEAKRAEIDSEIARLQAERDSL